MEDPEASVGKDAHVWEEHFKCLSSSYLIMTINMGVKGQGEGIQDRRRERITEIIKKTSASVIFCQEPPGKFDECGINGYTYKLPEEHRAVVMWRETDFQGEEVTDTDIDSIVERIEKMRPDVDLTEVRTRTAMVKLTSTSTTTGASFLAVSWHGPWTGVDEKTKRKVLYALICFLHHVCKMKNLSSFIVGGDFNLDTSTVDPVDLTEFEEVTISRYELCTRDEKRMQPQSQPKPGRKFVPFKDTFIFTVPSNKRPTTWDITVSSVKPLDFANNGSKNALLDHAPVEGVLKLVCSYRKDFTKCDRASSSSSGQPPSAIQDRYVTPGKALERPTIHAKVDDQQTAEIEEELAKLRIDGIHGSVSQAQPTEPHSQKTKVSASLLVEQASGRESTSEEKKTGKDKKERKR